MTETNEMRSLRVAVVGAGPAGVYASDILLRQLAQRGEELGIGTQATIDLYEKLPVPFGLVRYGVAPDHPAIKFIMGALEKTLNNPQIRLIADVEFGKDIDLDEMHSRYDAIIFATGAVDDRPLRIEGHDLKNVFGAAHFVEWYDGYPSAPLEWLLEAKSVAVIGGGNVAMDVSRLLVRYPDDLLGTDIPQNVYDGIGVNKAQEVHVFIRRGVAQAKFSVQELRELEALPGVQIIVNEEDFELDEETLEVAGSDKLTRQMVEELFVVKDMALDMADAGGVDFNGDPARRKYYLHFNANPVEIKGTDGSVSSIRVQRTSTAADGTMTSLEEFDEYPVQAVYHAIGYKPAEVTGIPYNESRYTLMNENGRVYTATLEEGGEQLAGVYTTGWAKRGPVGLIGSTKSDALETVDNILADWAASDVKGRTATNPDAADVLTYLQGKGVKPLDYASWKRVDAYERAEGAKAGREHIKVVDADLMRKIGQ